ncbi:hypothetical protein RND81_05G204100 [Saponaria officinalis]|uniref:Uncharacterized protein n=1 Tax=Saponaria officinalis TaxID=3572 RepID=A0AAW1KUM1_SAPOF
MIEKCVGVRKARQLHRLIRHCKVTFLCLVLTIIVLRGTIGAGKFGTPEQDFLEIRNRFASRKFYAHRVLEDVNDSNNNDRNSSVRTEELRSFDDDDELVVSSRSSSSSGKIVEHKFVSNRVGKPRVLLVTGSSSKPCQNSLGDYYLLKSIKNKIDYCRLHGIEIFYNMSLLEAEMLGFRAKLPLIRSLLAGHPEVEFVWWMDSDVMFTDMAFEVPWERYKGYNLVMHGSKEMVFEEKNWVGLNTGSFLIRNCQWSLDLIESWSKVGPSGKVRVEAGEISMKELKNTSFDVDDQSTMVYLLANEREKWGERVYLESDYYLSGFWESLVSKYETMLKNYKLGFGDHRWPLVTHFVGCKPCSKVGDYSKEKCLKEIERAFNVGDNQVYEVTHNSLSSTRVKKVPHDMLNQQAMKVDNVTKEVKVSSS